MTANWRKENFDPLLELCTVSYIMENRMQVSQKIKSRVISYPHCLHRGVIWQYNIILEFSRPNPAGNFLKSAFVRSFSRIYFASN